MSEQLTLMKRLATELEYMKGCIVEDPALNERFVKAAKYPILSDSLAAIHELQRRIWGLKAQHTRTANEDKRVFGKKPPKR
jgi:hypothetical protein